jgi:hypothetical protein
MAAALSRGDPCWQPDAAAKCCSHCEVKFRLFVRRHHCRKCGLIFCHACAPKISQPRLCIGCNPKPGPPSSGTSPATGDEDFNPTTASKSLSLHIEPPQEPPVRPQDEGRASQRGHTECSSTQKLITVPAEVGTTKEKADDEDVQASERKESELVKETTPPMLSFRQPFTSLLSPFLPRPLARPPSEHSPAQAKKTESRIARAASTQDVSVWPSVGAVLMLSLIEISVIVAGPIVRVPEMHLLTSPPVAFVAGTHSQKKFVP